MSSPEPEFRPRPLSHRTWLRLGVIAAIVAVVYVVVAYAYDAQGSLQATSDAGADSVAGLDITVEPTEVNAVTNQATARLTFKATDASLTDGTRLTQNVRVDVQSAGGDQEFRFPAGTVMSPQSLTIALDGEMAYYPFDTHTGDISVSADTFQKGADGTPESVAPVYVNVGANGGVSGWAASVDTQELPGSANVGFAFNRAFSTQIFALMLLALAVILAAATLIVGFLVASERRRAEIGLMSWTAALLFALPALRTFMPNSPPIGAAIDIYVYLWVMAGAIAAAVIMIVSWARQSGRMLTKDPTAAGGGVPGIPGAPSTDVTGD
jgi:hypothetical protein